MPFPVDTTRNFAQDTEDASRSSSSRCSPPRASSTASSAGSWRDRVTWTASWWRDTHDWYAQDDDGNVWYMGEEVINYEYDDDGNLLGTNSDGAWEAGVDGAQPGIIMWAAPQVGRSYYQEFYEGRGRGHALSSRSA